MPWLLDLNDPSKASSFFQSVFQHVTDAIFVIDKHGIIVEANPSAMRMIRWNAEDLIGKVHFCEVCRGMATCDFEVTCTECFAKKLRMPSFEMTIRTKDGKEFSVEASSTSVPVEEDAALVVILRDLSEQIRAEKARQQKMMTKHVFRAQEEERKRLSRELHDGIGQSLYSILVGLQVLNQQEMEHDVKTLIQDLTNMTSHTLDDVKNLAVDLRPAALDDLGLIPALRSYLRNFEKMFGIETSFDIKAPHRRLHPDVETAVYRICQEATINAAKYADTDKIVIAFEDKGEWLKLTIQDFGVGFDTTQIQIQGTGLGLYGMRERAEMLGGEVFIHSEPNQGTTITVRIPVSDKGE
ncbi:PAS domain S-box protein [Brevibacillus sp. SYP-B805]|uniref:PAS domain-containing sensor histidine kinase n=1 Tax=Brevibacillus sp. SYP-B805 TaxID=1578199 RepID=UPI0013EB9EC3|nr:PAS domain-containing sensor histidine kinase [Brevibacillus sp. SYP-B805]NGQ93928.1 PAS domain S-box protein [Brevibacillus sp. SYP-B805]